MPLGCSKFASLPSLRVERSAAVSRCRQLLKRFKLFAALSFAALRLCLQNTTSPFRRAMLVRDGLNLPHKRCQASLLEVCCHRCAMPRAHTDRLPGKAAVRHREKLLLLACVALSFALTLSLISRQSLERQLDFARHSIRQSAAGARPAVHQIPSGRGISAHCWHEVPALREADSHGSAAPH